MPRISYEWIGGKNLTQKLKNSKIQTEIAACEQKTTLGKANLCSNTVFSICFRTRVKKFRFRRDQTHYYNLTSKIKKMSEQVLKKTAISKYLNCNKESA